MKKPRTQSKLRRPSTGELAALAAALSPQEPEKALPRALGLWLAADQFLRGLPTDDQALIDTYSTPEQRWDRFIARLHAAQERANERAWTDTLTLDAALDWLAEHGVKWKKPETLVAHARREWLELQRSVPGPMPAPDPLEECLKEGRVPREILEALLRSCRSKRARQRSRQTKSVADKPAS